MGRTAYLSPLEALSEGQRRRLVACPREALSAVRRRGPRLCLVSRRGRGGGRGVEGGGLAARPAYAIEQYLEEADRRGFRIVRVLETHTHADHLSGHG